MATIKDVAKRAGVSISTVSRCINRSGYVGKNTREKIERACEELKFKPMQSARILKTKKSNIIAFVIPTLRNNFFVELASYIERECLKHNYKVVLCNIDESTELENSYIEMVEQHNFDGAIIATGTKVHKKLTELPLVLLDRFDSDQLTASLVSSDHKMGARQAVEHLVEKNCKHIAYIRPKEFSMPAVLRQEGYEEVLKENGLTSTVIEYENENELSSHDYTSYDGMFVWCDDTAVDVLFHALKNKISVPEDLKMIGFDNNFLSGKIYPSLSTVDQPYEQMAQEAVRVLIRNIESGEIDKQIRVLPTKLIKRETTE